MKATKAYIASLGTTGVLLAASILMLAVVSAVVAFNRWPSGGVSTRVQTLVLNEKAAPIRVSTNARGPSATPLARSLAAALGRPPVATPAPSAGPGLIAPLRMPGSTAPAAGVPATPALPKAPALPSPDPLLNPISNPGTATSQVADGAQTVTDQAGVSAGKVSPQAGDAVTQVGQTTADTLRSVPLPGHILPGH